MFGVPERRVDIYNQTYFYVPIAKPIPLNMRLEMTDKIISPEFIQQQKFNDLQKMVLNELTKTDSLFKNKPVYESLDRITPRWGIIYDVFDKPKWSPYTQEKFLFEESYPTRNCIVDLILKGIIITRSTIFPQFLVKFIDSADQIIDFDWQTPAVPAIEEIKEVTDLEAVPSGSGNIKLRSPASINKERANAKEQVKSLFRLAEEARDKALEAMSDFNDKYELSDNESHFSEWLESDTSDESDESDESEDENKD